MKSFELKSLVKHGRKLSVFVIFVQLDDILKIFYRKPKQNAKPIIL